MNILKINITDQDNEIQKASHDALTKLKESLKKDVKLRELEIENEQLRLNLKGGSGGTAQGNDTDQKLMSFYDFGRFDVNYTSNVASYLLKGKNLG